ncbi:MAG: phosphoribosylformylglycinamidine synthase [Anaerorhabdus sp.]
MKKRLYIRKKEAFQTEEKSLLSYLQMSVKNLSSVSIYNVYDIFNADDTDIKLLKEKVLAERASDDVFDTLDLKNQKYVAYEALPGQYDQRSDSAQACLMLLNSKDCVKIKSGKIIILNGNINNDDIKKIKDILINPVEMQEKNLSILEIIEDNTIIKTVIYDNFNNFNKDELIAFHKKCEFAMSHDDLFFIQEYFQKEKRNPSETELKVLDTYWSDHCRHTTFETVLKSIKIEKGKFSEKIQEAYELFLDLNQKYNSKDKPITLMNMATIGAKYMHKTNKLNDLEITDEINACSIEISVDVDGKDEDYLLMFKNETHNHPTEIEPFGGASTCIGGAIRDPLSGRSYVYQAARISGAGDILLEREKTLKNKLPQSYISKTAADGYSSYGNQIGLATTFVKEIYDDGYVAKRMEVGAVVGAAKKSSVLRKKPISGDIVVLLGGETGRDGIGGATGSSKEHSESSLTKSSSEVQKGNAPVERKLQRLFRNPKCTKLIKKANDFGAGGVSVAIGELADSIHIYLDEVSVKYAGLSATDLAISESQERMACVISKDDFETFKELAFEENLEVFKVAEITDNKRLVMEYKNEVIVDIKREFLDTNGIRLKQDVIISDSINEDNPFINLKQDILGNLKQKNVACQKGLVEMFDASIGRSSVLMPFGGKYQLSESEASVQKVAVTGFTNTASILSYGYHPPLSRYSPYLGGAYSVVEALTRLVCVGTNFKNARLSCQEYFEKLYQEPKKWGKVTQALLGLLEAQVAFETPAIGGKDSMSGSFNDLNVPPTLISFAVTTEKCDNIISSEFKNENEFIYLLKHIPNSDMSVNYEQLKNNFNKIYSLVNAKEISAMMSVKFGGLAEALCKMSLGNKIGIDIKTDEDLYNFNLGSIVLTCKNEINDDSFIYLGKTNSSNNIHINDDVVTIDEAINAWKSRYSELYPISANNIDKVLDTPVYNCDKVLSSTKYFERPKVIIPVFPGTNCEIDSAKAFERAGGDVEIYIFKNINVKALNKSIDELSDKISKAQILMIPGGFSSGDEPDGSGKYIANVLCNEKVNNAVHTLLENDGLILGICNGFQALVKSNLLPFGDIKNMKHDALTLFKNDINRHVSTIAKTKVTSNKSPWLKGFKVNEVHSVAMSHGEGKFVVSERDAKELFENGQVAMQYVDHNGDVNMNGEYNINGSYYAIEAITSPDGRILGKMGHSERYEDGLYKNIDGNKLQDIFACGIEYFKNKEKKK